MSGPAFFLAKKKLCVNWNILAMAKSQSEPHHHVFYLCEAAIIRGVKIEAVLDHLIEKKVVPKSDIPRYSDKPKNGMKILIGYLKNRSFQTFLDFVECILLAQWDAPSKAQSMTVVDSIIKAVEDFDQRNDTSWTDDVRAIQQKYIKIVLEHEEYSQEDLDGKYEFLPASLYSHDH